MATASAPQRDDIAAFYESTGLARRVGFGSNPAVLLIDMQVQWGDPTRRLGADMGPLLDAAERLVDAARAKDVPVVYVWSAWAADGADAGRWVDKIPALVEITPGSPGAEIEPRIAPRDGDRVVLKKGPSGFFNTPLDPVLRDLSVDTILLAGASTSGCIRATAIDCLQHGYRTVVAAEAVGDRAFAPHEANLLDIDAKYADVMPLARIAEYLASLPASPAVRAASAEPPRPTPPGQVAVVRENVGTNVPRRAAPYAQVRSHGGLVFTAGQIAFDPDDPPAFPMDAAAQTECALDAVESLLRSSGSDLAKVLHATVYLADLADWPAMNDVFAGRFSEVPPARASVAVGLPEGIRVEIAVVAHV